MTISAMTSVERLVWVELSAEALAENICFLLSFCGEQAPLFCAPVKANAYGHGLTEIVRLLSQQPVDYLAVHSLEEASAVRRARWKKNILTVGYIPLSGVAEALKLEIEPTIYNLENLQTWKTAAKKLNKVAQIHIKVETGANRQGAAGTRLSELFDIIRKSRNLNLKGLSTHFANIEDTTDHSFALLQLKRFKSALKLCDKHGLRPEIRHTAASAAHLVMPDTRFDMIRPGIALYGHWPSKETLVSFRHSHPHQSKEIALRPVLSLKSRLAQIKTIGKGQTVGYGLTFQAQRRMKIGVLPLGYYDGLPRALSDCAYALVNGVRAPYLGRVSMNNIVIDLSAVGQVGLENEVTLIGSSGSARVTMEQIATWSSTINYEALTRIGAHLPRLVV